MEDTYEQMRREYFERLQSTDDIEWLREQALTKSKLYNELASAMLHPTTGLDVMNRAVAALRAENERFTDEVMRLRRTLTAISFINADAMSPIDALTKVYELKREATEALKGE